MIAFLGSLAFSKIENELKNLNFVMIFGRKNFINIIKLDGGYLY